MTDIDTSVWQVVYREDDPHPPDPYSFSVLLLGPNGARYPAICEDVSVDLDPLRRLRYVCITATPDFHNAPDPVRVESVLVGTVYPFNQHPLVKEIPLNGNVYFNYGDTITVHVTISDNDVTTNHLRGHRVYHNTPGDTA